MRHEISQPARKADSQIVIDSPIFKNKKTFNFFSLVIWNRTLSALIQHNFSTDYLVDKLDYFFFHSNYFSLKKMENLGAEILQINIF